MAEWAKLLPWLHAACSFDHSRLTVEQAVMASGDLNCGNDHGRTCNSDPASHRALPSPGYLTNSMSRYVGTGQRSSGIAFSIRSATFRTVFIAGITLFFI